MLHHLGVASAVIDAGTLIQTAKPNDVDALGWLKDVLERTVAGRNERNEMVWPLP